MSKLISGKEALIALANGEKLQAKDAHDWKDVTWNMPLAMFDTPMIVFRLKPRTITISGVEYIDKQGAYEAFMEVYNEMDIHPEI